MWIVTYYVTTSIFLSFLPFFPLLSSSLKSIFNHFRIQLLFKISYQFFIFKPLRHLFKFLYFALFFPFQHSFVFSHSISSTDPNRYQHSKFLLSFIVKFFFPQSDFSTFLSKFQIPPTAIFHCYQCKISFKFLCTLLYNNVFRLLTSHSGDLLCCTFYFFYFLPFFPLLSSPFKLFYTNFKFHNFF
jgi:hypothetical protein